MTDDLEAAVQAAVQMLGMGHLHVRSCGLSCPFRRVDQIVRRVAAVARRDALRDARDQFDMVPSRIQAEGRIDHLLAEAEEAVRH